MKSICLYYRWAAILCLLMIHLLPLRAEWSPFVMHFDKKTLGKAQTWQIAPLGERWIYFANQGGMLQFDGTGWERFSLHNRSDVRSVYPSSEQQRLYVGGINEYGYLTPATNGTLHYTCLTDSLPGEYREIGNVWGIHENDNILYFQGDGRVVKAVNGKYSMVEAPAKITCSSLVGGTLYIGTSEGVHFLVGNTFFPLQDGEQLRQMRICGMAPFRGGMLIATALQGLYFSDGHSVTPFLTGAEAFLTENEVYCLAVHDEQIALGTIRRGILWMNAATGQLRYMNEDTGLQNNTVLSLAFDNLGNLWAGLDDGIDYLWMNAPLTNLYTRNHFFGTGYTAAVAADRLYLGTNRGLYVTAFPVVTGSRPVDIQILSAGSGQVWDLCKVGDELFCAHDRGLYLVSGTSLQRISTLTGVWTCQAVMGQPDRMYVGAYDGLYVYLRKDGQWTPLHKVEGIKDSFRRFRQLSARVLWLQQDDMLLRFELTDDLRRAVLKESLPAVSARSEVTALFQSEAAHRILNHPVAQLIEPVNGSWHIIPLEGGGAILPHEEGFALYTPQDSLHPATKPHRFRIKRMYVTSPRDSLVYTDNFLDRTCSPRLRYADNSVRFEYSLLHSDLLQGIRFRYRLNGGKWSDLSEMDRKEFSNLYEGHYTFEVEAILPGGETDSDSLSFTVRPPWYRSVVAWIVYALLLVVMVRKAFRWDARRLARKQQMAVAQKDLEMVVITKEYEKEKERQERQISALEKEKLEHELEHKSQEMMNLMIGMKRKNEVLSEIKADLLKVTHSLRGEPTKECKQQLLVINSKIDDNMQSDDVLRRIEEQFDLLHNDFMKRLHERFPDLSSNEYMMCAYLKMELSTKEMAPLLGISVRGVETLRYRLRKKFGLEREDGILDFLNQL